MPPARLLKPTPEAIEEAAEAIVRGDLVVMPTETVYGLAADALNPNAVAKIFEAKGRPSENPLIVHVADKEMAQQLVSAWPKEADVLANRFWPGPLTLVLSKSSAVPANITGGLETVAIRAPSHLVALGLIGTADRPLAAPSANRFMGLSPTAAEHVDPELLKHVDIVLEGGPCEIGIESTVLDLTAEPTILRPGKISQIEIEYVLRKPVLLGSGALERRSPGLYPKHYAPQANVKLVESSTARAALVFGTPIGEQIQMPREPQQYATWLYAALHHLDSLGARTIEIEAPPKGAAWSAIWDRLEKMVTP